MPISKHLLRSAIRLLDILGNCGNLKIVDAKITVNLGVKFLQVRNMPVVPNNQRD